MKSPSLTRLNVDAHAVLNAIADCHPHGVHGPSPTAGSVREGEQHAQQMEASISKCNMQQADYETTTGDNGVLGNPYHLSVEARFVLCIHNMICSELSALTNTFLVTVHPGS